MIGDRDADALAPIATSTSIPIGTVCARHGDATTAMNFVEDVLENFPAARPALITLSESGERRVWGFGELIARSGGLDPFAARPGRQSLRFAPATGMPPPP